MDDATPCDHPQGALAVVTPVRGELDGELTAILMSEELPPSRVTPENMTSPTNDEVDTQTSLSEDIQLPQLVPSFLSTPNTSDFFRRLVRPVYPPKEEDLLDIINCILSGTLLVCSDGSFSQHSGTGSHAWVFATATRQILLQGAGPIDCHPKQLSSYRPELGGITSLLFLLRVIVHIGSITAGSVMLYCDNKSALENVFDSEPKRGIYPLLAVDYDLLVLAKDILQAIPIQVNNSWVKGHYTGDQREVQHDLNALVDTLATSFRESPPAGYEPSAEPRFHPLQTVALYQEG
jgi:hypothetical protein